ncbi:hypothetical protein CHGG_00284 [Chaetomium globosum CBS 148.51]|uniref:Aminotransferase class I/classII large domain-containing protein n=1 Tax=Chaetomium globosum (strain ATCC 6205 / CBS 148.51 / DSM 1962 / NBRC 6347 / NRRL 1970) TaxID=306901 RepID=Q2HHM0_CHAGB|nr:uncharacterized protein CHGG_00284 [Chaetomium globosum CBS 148.51]EAQ92049.1 hypothetical protein CHGG_00284 [Chaetomium globosum CBS 148.51]
MSQKAQNNALDDVLASLLDRRRARNQLRGLTTVPDGTVDFSSNDYLSLSSQPAVQQAFLTRLQGALSPTTTGDNSRPSSLLGSGGSRLLDGNSLFAESLECMLAEFHGAPAALLFNSAMDANVGLFSCVPQPGDVIVYDRLIHASVHDGMRLSRASKRIPFAHSHVWDAPGDLGTSSSTAKSLEAVLRGLLQEPDGSQLGSGKRNVFIAVEGVYSMDGDVAPLADIVECVERYLCQGNGYIIVDEAHSAGIFGDRGQGLVSMVLCSPTTRSYLINYARTLIYTTAMAFPSLASIEAAYTFLAAGRAKQLRSHLEVLVQGTHKLLLTACARHRPPPELLRVSPAKPRSPVIPVLTSRPRDLAKYCQQKGYMVRPIVAPTVPKGEERIRICLHAKNSIVEVEGLIKAMEEWLLEAMNREGEPEGRVVTETDQSQPSTQDRAVREAKI